MNSKGLIVSLLLGSGLAYVLFKGSEAEAKASPTPSPMPTPAPPPIPGKPPYVSKDKNGWYLCDPKAVTTMIPPEALTKPLNPGEIVSYYMADDLPPDVAKVIILVTAKVLSKSLTNVYKVEIVSVYLFRGTAEQAPTQLPSKGMTAEVYRDKVLAFGLL